MEQISFHLEPIPPFRLDLTVLALRRRPENIVDRWNGQTYRRILVVDHTALEVAVTQHGQAEVPQLQVKLQGPTLPAYAMYTATKTLERALGLSVDLSAFYHLVANDERLGPLAVRFRGFKPPRFPSLFEAVINGIACQQFTLTLGMRLLNRLATAYGRSFPTEAAVRAFPEPETLAAANPEAFRQLGFSSQKANAISELSRNIAAGRFSLQEMETWEDEAVYTALAQLRGVGRWTAEYVSLRGLGRLHVFPADDVGGRNNLARFLHISPPRDYDEVKKLLDPWQPYAGLIYFFLFLERLTVEGVSASAEP